MVKQLFKKTVRPIYFEKLIFRKPYSEFYAKTHSPLKVVFFSGIRRLQGVYVVRYTNYLGITRYDITKVKLCLYNAALAQYNILLANNATDIEFAFIPAQKGRHQLLVNSLKSGLLHMPLSNHYELVKDCINNTSVPVPPVEAFKFRKIFTEAPFGKKRFTFLEANGHGGVYIIIKEGVSRVQHVGLSEDDISDVLRNHFYKNDHVDYWKEPHLYSAAIIDIPLRKVKNLDSLREKIKILENRLIQAYDPIDNKNGKLVKEGVQILDNPWSKEKVLGVDPF